MEKIKLDIEGMSCNACAQRIEKVLKKKQGISDAYVSFAGEEASVSFDESNVSCDMIVEWVNKTGFKATVKNEGKIESKKNQGSFPWRLVAIWVLSIPFWIGMVGMFTKNHSLMPSPLTQWILASIVQLFLVWNYYKNAWASLKAKFPNMDVLVSLGTLSIYIYSSIVFFMSLKGGAQNGAGAGANLAAQGYHVYFEASVMIFAFVTLGKWLEERTKHQSLNSIELLLELTPKSQEMLVEGKWVLTDLANITKGSLLRVRQGDKIAADGIMTEGELEVDESHLTGEPRALLKKQGDALKAGSIVIDGLGVYESKALGDETFLGDMIKALDEAQGSKAPIARIADKIAAVFVPTIVGIALITFVANYFIKGSFDVALVNAVSVLVIACPCALGLATPAAIMVGMGLAARHGVLFKNAAIMEAASSIDTLTLDKTGTLTYGTPKVVAIAPLDMENGNLLMGDVTNFFNGSTIEKEPSYGEQASGQANGNANTGNDGEANTATSKSMANDSPSATANSDVDASKVQNTSSDSNSSNLDEKLLSIISIAASIEETSHHPWAMAIKEKAEELGVSTTQAVNTQQLVGKGMEGELDGIEGRIKVGSISFVTGKSKVENLASDLSGLSLIAVGVDGKPMALLALDDVLRKDAPHAVTQIKNMGITPFILSGDDEEVVRKIANQAGVNVEKSRGDLSPRDKKEIIEKEIANGHKTAMAGDGVNDAPAMAVASVGFAMNSGTDIAKNTADVTLVGEEIRLLRDAFHISRATMRNIKQNLFFALIYNVIGIFFAATGYLNPMIAAAAMAMSSISVLSNALRLKRLKFD